MTKSWESAGPEFYEEIFEAFDDHPKWEYDDRIGRDEAASRSAEAPEEAARLEYSFRHPETGAVLTAGIPDLNRQPPAAVAGALTQGQTLAEDREDDELLSSLKMAQGAVSERAVPDNEPYVEPVEDLWRVALVEVPFDYRDDDMESAVDTLSAVAENVGEMHNEVYEVLDRYRGT